MSRPLSSFQCIPSDQCVGSHDWGSGEEDNTHPMMHLSLNGAYLLSLHSFFLCAAGDELPGEWSVFLLPRGVWQTTHTHTRWRAPERLPPENLKRRTSVCAPGKQCVCLFAVCLCFLTPAISVWDYKGRTHEKRAKDISANTWTQCRSFISIWREP